MKNTKLIIAIGLIIIIIAGCSEQTNNKHENCSPEAKISLDNFDTIPRQVVGCTGLFFETEEKFKTKEYLFIAWLGGGVISINNKLINLECISSEYKSKTFGNLDHTDIYANDCLKVIIEIKFKKTNKPRDLCRWTYGKLTIETKGGQKLTRDFVGETKC